MEKNNNHMTIEDLAAMVKRSFDTMATRDDVRALEQRMATKEDLKEVWEALNATHTDVRYIRSTVDMLARSSTAHEASIKDLTARVHRLEQKVGFAK